MTTTLPTLWLSNGASHRTPGRHGPGRKWHAMAKPAQHDLAEGRVTVLVPPKEAIPLLDELLRQRQEYGEVDPETVEAYRAIYDRHLATMVALLPPGALMALTHARQLAFVEDGATINCRCAADEALAGRCHLAFAVPHLLRAKWRVILHGQEQQDG